MPVYDFKCRDCGEVSEILIRGGDRQTVRCANCGGESLEKLISSSYMIKMDAPTAGATCCGRAERCDTPPCSNEESCRRG